MRCLVNSDVDAATCWDIDTILSGTDLLKLA